MRDLRKSKPLYFLQFHDLNLLHSLNRGNPRDGAVQLGGGMDAEVDGAAHYFVLCPRVEASHRNAAAFDNAVDNVLQEMISVNGGDLDSDRIDYPGIRLEILYGNYGMPPFRGGSDGIRAVSVVDGNVAVSVLETDQFSAFRKRMAMRAEDVRLPDLLLEIACNMLFRLVCHD